MDDYIMDLLFLPSQAFSTRSPAQIAAAPKAAMESFMADEQFMLYCLGATGTLVAGVLLRCVVKRLTYNKDAYQAYPSRSPVTHPEDDAPPSTPFEAFQQRDFYHTSPSTRLLLNRPRPAPPLSLNPWPLTEYRRGDYCLPRTLTPRESSLLSRPLNDYTETSLLNKPLNEYTGGSITETPLTKYPPMGSTQVSPPRIERAMHGRLSFCDNGYVDNRMEKRPRFLTLANQEPCESSQQEFQKDQKQSICIDEFNDVMYLRANGCTTSSVSKISLQRSPLTKSSRKQSIMKSSKTQSSVKEDKAKSRNGTKQRNSSSPTKSGRSGANSGISPLFISAGKYAVQVTTVDPALEQVQTKGTDLCETETDALLTENSTLVSFSKPSESRESIATRSVMQPMSDDGDGFISSERCSTHFRARRRKLRTHGVTYPGCALVGKMRKLKKKTLIDDCRSLGNTDVCSKSKDCDQSSWMSKPNQNDENTTAQLGFNPLGAVSSPSLAGNENIEIRKKAEQSTHELEKSESFDIRDPKYFSTEKREAETEKEEGGESHINTKHTRFSTAINPLKPPRQKPTSHSNCVKNQELFGSKHSVILTEKGTILIKEQEKVSKDIAGDGPDLKEVTPAQKSNAEKDCLTMFIDEDAYNSLGKGDTSLSFRRKPASDKDDSERTGSQVLTSNMNKNRIRCNNQDLTTGRSIDLVTFSKRSSFGLSSSSKAKDLYDKMEGNSKTISTSKSMRKNSIKLTESAARINVLNELRPKTQISKQKSKELIKHTSPSQKRNKYEKRKPMLPKRQFDSSTKDKSRQCGKNSSVSDHVGDTPETTHKKEVLSGLFSSLSNSIKPNNNVTRSHLSSSGQQKMNATGYFSLLSHDNKDTHVKSNGLSLKQTKCKVQDEPSSQDSEMTFSRLPCFKFNNEYLLYIESPPESNPIQQLTSLSEKQHPESIFLPISGGKLQIFRSLTPQLSVPSSEGKQSDAQKMNDVLVEERIEQLREYSSRHNKMKRQHRRLGSESSGMSLEMTRPALTEDVGRFQNLHGRIKDLKGNKYLRQEAIHNKCDRNKHSMGKAVISNHLENKQNSTENRREKFNGRKRNKSELLENYKKGYSGNKVKGVGRFGSNGHEIDEHFEKETDDNMHLGGNRLDKGGHLGKKCEKCDKKGITQHLASCQRKKCLRNNISAKDSHLESKLRADEFLSTNSFEQNEYIGSTVEGSSGIKKEQIDGDESNQCFQNNKRYGKRFVASKRQVQNHFGNKKRYDRLPETYFKSKGSDNKSFGNNRKANEYSGSTNGGNKYVRRKELLRNRHANKYLEKDSAIELTAQTKKTAMNESNFTVSRRSLSETGLKDNSKRQPLPPDNNPQRDTLEELNHSDNTSMQYSNYSQATIQYSKGHRDLQQLLDEGNRVDDNDTCSQQPTGIKLPSPSSKNHSDYSQKLYEDILNKRKRKLKRKLSPKTKPNNHPSRAQPYFMNAPKQKRISCDFNPGLSKTKLKPISRSSVLENEDVIDSDFGDMKLYVRDYERGRNSQRWSSSSHIDSWSRPLDRGGLKKQERDTDVHCSRQKHLPKCKEVFAGSASNQDSISELSFNKDLMNGPNQDSKNNTLNHFSIRKPTLFHDTEARNKTVEPLKRSASHTPSRDKKLSKHEKGRENIKPNDESVRKQNMDKSLEKIVVNAKTKGTTKGLKQIQKITTTKPESKPPAQSRLAKMKKLRYKFHKAPVKPKNTLEEMRSASVSEFMNSRDPWSTNSSTKKDTQPIDTSSYQVLQSNGKDKPVAASGGDPQNTPKFKMRHPRYNMHKVVGKTDKAQMQDSQTKSFLEKREPLTEDKDVNEAKEINGAGECFTSTYKTLHKMRSKAAASPPPVRNEQHAGVKVLNLKYKLRKSAPKTAQSEKSNQHEDKKKKTGSEKDCINKNQHDSSTYGINKEKNQSRKSPSPRAQIESTPTHLSNEGFLVGKDMKCGNLGGFARRRQLSGGLKPVLKTGRNNTADIAIGSAWNRKTNKTPKGQSYLQAFRESTKTRSPSLQTSIQSTEKPSELNLPKPQVESDGIDLRFPVNFATLNMKIQSCPGVDEIDIESNDGHKDERIDFIMDEDQGSTQNQENSDRDSVPFPTLDQYNPCKTQRGLSSILSNLACIEDLDPDEEEKLSLPQHLPDLIMTSSVDSSGGAYNRSGYSNSDFISRPYGSNETRNHVNTDEINMLKTNEDMNEDCKGSIRLSLSPTFVNGRTDNVAASDDHCAQKRESSPEKAMDIWEAPTNLNGGVFQIAKLPSRTEIVESPVQLSSHHCVNDARSSRSGQRSNSSVIKRISSPEHITSTHTSSDFDRSGRGYLKQRHSMSTFPTPNFHDIFKDTKTLQRWTKSNTVSKKSKTLNRFNTSDDAKTTDSTNDARMDLKERSLSKGKANLRCLTHEIIKTNPPEKNVFMTKSDPKIEENIYAMPSDNIKGRFKLAPEDKRGNGVKVEKSPKSNNVKSSGAKSGFSYGASSSGPSKKWRGCKTDSVNLKEFNDTNGNIDVTKSEKSNVQSCSDIVISWMDDNGRDGVFKSKQKITAGLTVIEETRDQKQGKHMLLSSTENTTVGGQAAESCTEKGCSNRQEFHRNLKDEKERDVSFPNVTLSNARGENIFLKMARIKRPQRNEHHVTKAHEENFSMKRDQLGKSIPSARGSAYYVKSAMSYNKKKSLCSTNNSIETYSLGNSGDETSAQDQTNQLTAFELTSNLETQPRSVSTTAAVASVQSPKRMTKNNNKTRVTLTSMYTTRIDAFEHDDTQTTHNNTCSTDNDKLMSGDFAEDVDWDDTSNDVSTDELCSGCSSSWGACASIDKVPNVSTFYEHSTDETESNSSRLSSNDHEDQRSKPCFLLDWYRPSLQAKAEFEARTDTGAEAYDDDNNDDDYNDANDTDDDDITNDDDDSLYESVTDECVDSDSLDSSSSVQKDTQTHASKDRSQGISGARGYATPIVVQDGSTSSRSCPRSQAKTNSRYTDPSFRSTFTWCNRHRTLNHTLSNNTRPPFARESVGTLDHGSTSDSKRTYSIKTPTFDHCQCQQTEESNISRDDIKASVNSVGNKETRQKDLTVDLYSSCTGSVSSVDAFSTICHHYPSDSGMDMHFSFSGKTAQENLTSIREKSKTASFKPGYFQRQAVSSEYSSLTNSWKDEKLFRSRLEYKYNSTSTGAQCKSNSQSFAQERKTYENKSVGEETTFCTCASSESVFSEESSEESVGSSFCSTPDFKLSLLHAPDSTVTVGSHGSRRRTREILKGLKRIRPVYYGMHKYNERKPTSSTKRMCRHDIFSMRDCDRL